jgi:sulfopyruvate decarboxylase TPP-binding subunit
MLVTMRGEWGEFNPWQVPLGRCTEQVLDAAGVAVFNVREPSEIVETVRAAASFAWHTGRAVAVLISQRIVGAKSFRSEGQAK